MSSIIQTIHLSKTYNPDTVPVPAVSDVSLQIGEGEFTALVGPSGSGKTTLLNLIGGLDYPTGGEVQIDGQDITKMSENRLIDFRLHNIGFVFQAYNLIPVLTAAENIEFVMLMLRKTRRERQQRVDELLQEVGLADKRDKRPTELSGGQQQRVAVARALASKPRFILADEPTANLDSHSAENLLEIMAKLNGEEKMTFVFSTHDQRVIDKAKRVVTLVDGRIVSDTRA
ncbi:MAG TPA: ABC transporter ATP-binding protein [Puia sp.]|nr:ABC transporter ATP-binding protein [Puia sp.]